MTRRSGGTLRSVPYPVSSARHHPGVGRVGGSGKQTKSSRNHGDCLLIVHAALPTNQVTRYRYWYLCGR